MSILVFVEAADKRIKNTSLEAVSFAAALGGEVTAVVLGQLEAGELEKIGPSGASKVLHADDAQLNSGVIQVYASALAQAVTKAGADTVVLAKSSLGDSVAARLAVKIGAGLVSNVVALPNGTKIKRGIYTGKAFAHVEVKGSKRIIAVKKNAIALKTDGAQAQVEKFAPAIESGDFKAKIISQEKTKGQVLLPEADIVVSGGRGLKGPENWGMVEQLASALGAATGCSKPVSDMDWRPHHEHVGQTGVKVSPSLYIAIGISGAIQHLAGVNSSKYIVVINKDPEAPFFKAADYGIAADAFEVVPKLTEAIKALNN